MQKPLILGVGSGRCGTHSLAALLDAQGGVACSHELRPILPWDDSYAPYLAERFACIRQRPAQIVGDVSGQYLNYLPQALADPLVRVIGLKRDREETVESFVRWKTRNTKGNPWNSFSLNRRPPTTEGVLHWQMAHPRYPSDDLRECLRLYWTEYYQRLEAIAAAHPGRVRIYATDALNDQAMVRQMLSFVGVAPQDQIIAHPREART